MTDKASVSTKHPQYEASIFAWRQVRDCIEGEAQIKRRDTVYLPMPSGMLNATKGPSIQTSASSSTSALDQRNRTIDQDLNPNYHTNPAFMAYKTRAQFPDITAFSLRGLIGVALRKDATIELPNTYDYLEGMVEDLYSFSISEVLQTGRLGYLVDIADDGNFKILPYEAESIINWRQETKKDVEGVNTATTMVVLEEYVPKLDDPFASELQMQYRVLELIDGVYTSTLYTADGDIIPVLVGKEMMATITPMYKGKTLNKIPFFFAGSTNTNPTPNVIPLGSISSIAIQVYMKSADLSQSEFLSCNPTLVLQGVSKEDAPIVVGSSVAICLPDPESKAYYTETDTAALQHVMAHIKELFEQAVAYGANLLGGSSKSVESGEALRLRQSAASATLISVIRNIEKAFDDILDLIAMWAGADPEAFNFDPDKDLVDLKLTAQEITALVSAWMTRGLSQESLVDNLRRAGYVIEGRTALDEIAAILEEGPQGSTGGETGAGE
jgi:hypothetical protein